MSAVVHRRASVAGGLAVMLISFALGGSAVASAAGAAPVKVTATDDGAGPGTCPSTNSWGAPTNGNCFKPEAIQIRIGSRVEWTNTGQRPHDIVADDGSFKSPMLSAGGTWSFTFRSAGTFRYYCSLHGAKDGSGQAGEITVSSGKAPPSGARVAAPPSPKSTRAAAPRATGLVATTISLDVRGAPVEKVAAHEGIGGSAGPQGYFLTGLGISIMSGLLLRLLGQHRRADRGKEKS